MNGDATSNGRCQRPGDRASREAFVRATYAELFRWFRRVTGSPDRAADLTQESFAAFWGSVDRIRSDVSPRTWLYAIGRNLQYYDAPAVREISREASRNNNTFAALISGVVKSAPFQMRQTQR